MGYNYKFGVLLTFSLALAASACSTAEDAVDGVVDLVDGDDEPPAKPSRAANELCQAMIDRIVADEESGECDYALAEDCMEVIDTFAQPYLDAVYSCIVDDGGHPATCMYDNTNVLQPTEAHYDLAEDYCEDCLYDIVDGCEDVFFDKEDEAGLGSIFVPFSEEVVRDIADECTSDLICAADLLTCSQGVLKERLIPDKTGICLLKEILF